jgi:Uma2 family endonuclease
MFKPAALASPVTTRRFTIVEYRRLIDMGILTEADGVELIRGELIKMAAKGTPHTSCNTNLLYELLPILGHRALVRHQDPVTLIDESEPEPDFAIVHWRDDRYATAHPQPDEIFWLIEVSDSTLEYDQTEKLRLYAESGIPHYWIVNLKVDRLQRYSLPYQDANSQVGYRIQEISLPNEQIPLPSFADARLDLSKVFPLRPA